MEEKRKEGKENILLKSAVYDSTSLPLLVGRQLGGLYHDSGGHGGLHIYLEPGTPVGSVHHGWRMG